MPKLAYRTTLPRPDDPQLLQAIYDDVAFGIPLRYAAVLAGIAENTAYHWITDYQHAIDQAPPGTPLEELGSAAVFGHTVKEARAALVRDRVGVIREGGKPWAAAMTLLERVMPDDFGRRPATVTIDQRTVHVTISPPPGDVSDALTTRLQRLLPAPPDQLSEPTDA